jgi:hypothetical protein
MVNGEIVRSEELVVSSDFVALQRNLTNQSSDNLIQKTPYSKNRLPFTILLFTIYLLLFTITEQPAFAKKIKVSTPESQYKYQQKVYRDLEKEKYQRSLLPESGYMTTDDYEKKSKDVPNIATEIPEYKLPKDIKMKYVPTPVYKLVLYNNPPGTQELHLQKRFKYDRQMNCTGVTSPNMDIMVYPVVYYYASSQCTAGDLFMIVLDQSLSYLDRVKRANVVKRVATPILSTDKDVMEKYTFRTLTPIDFSTDGTRLVAKEKIGNFNDGIWQTNLWVYDFVAQKGRNLSEVRDAIRFYWKNTKHIYLDEKRWDIYPLGFDANNPDRIIVSAYGYTGKTPKFLGNWSIDVNGEQSQLVSLFDAKATVSMNGLKLNQVGVVEPAILLNEEKREDKSLKKQRKYNKKLQKEASKIRKKALKTELKEMKKEENKKLHEYHKQQNIGGPTGTE